MKSRQTKTIYHNEYIDFAQINSNVKDKKWVKVTIAIVGDAIMWGIRKELLKTDKHDVKVKFFRSETNEEMEDNLS